MRSDFRLSTRRSFLAMGAGLLSASRCLRAQEGDAPTPEPIPTDTTFSTSVKVVNVLATVRTKGGSIVGDLTRDDFLLSEDGKGQTIRYFSRETDLPLTMGLLVDTSGSQRNVLGEEESASFRFLDKVLREDKDRTFLVRFDFESELLQDLTSSKEKLRTQLETLENPSRWRWRGGGRGRGGGGTTLYDAVYLSSDELMRKLRGRKALILLTDGVDHGSRTSISDAIEAAQRADTLIYSILFDGDEGGGFRGGGGPYWGDMPDGKKVLQQMSRETGGGFFEVSKRQPIDTIYRRIEEELRSQYNLGYSPEKRALIAGEYRAINVRTRRKDLIVQARAGYYTND